MDEDSKVQAILQNPPLSLSEKRFLLTCSDDVVSSDEKAKIKEELLESVKEKGILFVSNSVESMFVQTNLLTNAIPIYSLMSSQLDMLPFYLALVEQFKWPRDEKIVATMEKNIEEKVKDLKAKIVDAEENLGESEVREGLLNEAEYYARIGDKEKAVSAYRVAIEKTVGLGEKLDVVFSQVRLGLFWDDEDLTRRNIEKSKEMLVSGGDWERRNRSKVYEGLHLMGKREWESATKLFLETLATYTCVELFDYNTFIFYTVILSLVTLPRLELKKRVIDSPEVLSGIDETASLGDLLNSFYNLDYRVFFRALAVITDRLKRDRYLSSMAGYFCREMRVKAYCQLLESYKSVTLASLAEAFGVSEEFIDKELSRFINSGRVHCKIDAVRGVVETIRVDSKNAQYQVS